MDLKAGRAPGLARVESQGNGAIRADAYEIPDRIIEYLALRDGTCVSPYCTRPPAPATSTTTSSQVTAAT